MSAIRLDMSMSLDGFIAGPDDRPGQEMGDGGFRLFNWLDGRHEPGPDGTVYADSMATGWGPPSTVRQPREPRGA